MPPTTLIPSPHQSMATPDHTNLRGIEEAAPRYAFARERLTHNGDVAGEIELALRATGYQSLRSVKTRVAEGLVILRGRVPSYYLKQKAQTVVLEVPGVTEVQNELDVVMPRMPCL